MEIRNVLERLKLLTNDDREDLLLMLSGDAVQRLKARLCCTVEEENAHEEALCAAAAAQAAYQFWLLEEAASPKSLTAGEVRYLQAIMRCGLATLSEDADCPDDLFEALRQMAQERLGVQIRSEKLL